MKMKDHKKTRPKQRSSNLQSKDKQQAKTNQDDWHKPVECQGNARETVRKIVKIIEQHYYLFLGWSNAFDQVLDLILYALNKDEEKYMKLVGQMDKRAVDKAAEISGLLIKAFCHDYCIWDYLGEVYIQIGSLSKSKAFGQFFTPFHICEMMAKMQFGDIKQLIAKAKKENRKITVDEPCVGSGAMLLACKKVIIEEAGLAGLDYFEFYGTDIDVTCVKMCKIQMLLTSYRYMTGLLLLHLCRFQENMAAPKEQKLLSAESGVR